MGDEEKGKIVDALTNKYDIVEVSKVDQTQVTPLNLMVLI